MDFGPSPTEIGSLWTLQPPAPLSQALPAAAPALQHHAPLEAPPFSEQQNLPAAAEEPREKPLRSRLRGAKRKAGDSSALSATESAGFPAELFKSPAERNSSLDRRRVQAPTLRSMR